MLFHFQLCTCGVWGGGTKIYFRENNNSQGILFWPCLFFGQKHPRLKRGDHRKGVIVRIHGRLLLLLLRGGGEGGSIYPRYSAIAGFGTQKKVYVQHMLRRKAAECGVVQRTNETQQCPRSAAQAQCAQRAVMQVRRRHRHYTARQSLRMKCNRHCGCLMKRFTRVLIIALCVPSFALLCPAICFCGRGVLLLPTSALPSSWFWPTPSHAAARTPSSPSC